MKFTADSQELARAAAACSKATLKKVDAGALCGILIKANGNTATLAGYDLSTGIKMKIQANVEEPGTAVLSSRLADILKKLPNNAVTLTVKGNIAEIESGETQYSLMCMKVDTYPELPDCTAEQYTIIPKETLLSMIRQTVFSVALPSDGVAQRAIFTGVRFELNSGEIKCIGIDGARMAIRKEAIEYSGDSLNFVVLAVALSNVSVLMSKEKDDEVKVFVSKRHVSFVTNQCEVFTRLLEGNFLKYQDTIPKVFNTTVEVDTAEIISSVERVSVIVSDKVKSPLRCQLEDGNFKFSVATSTGSAQDTIVANIEGDVLEIGFNHKFLLEALRATETDRVRLQFCGPAAPATITPLHGDSFLFLILPVRLRKGDEA